MVKCIQHWNASGYEMFKKYQLKIITNKAYVISWLQFTFSVSYMLSDICGQYINLFI